MHSLLNKTVPKLCDLCKHIAKCLGCLPSLANRIPADCLCICIACHQFFRQIALIARIAVSFSSTTQLVQFCILSSLLSTMSSKRRATDSTRKRSLQLAGRQLPRDLELEAASFLDLEDLNALLQASTACNLLTLQYLRRAKSLKLPWQPTPALCPIMEALRFHCKQLQTVEMQPLPQCTDRSSRHAVLKAAAHWLVPLIKQNSESLQFFNSERAMPLASWSSAAFDALCECKYLRRLNYWQSLPQAPQLQTFYARTSLERLSFIWFGVGPVSGKTRCFQQLLNAGAG